MIEIAKEVILVTDSSKFKRKSLAFICGLDKIKKVVTDKNIPADDKKEIQDRIKAYLARFKWRTQGFYQVANSNDKMVKAALNEIKK
jgi:hypothetical protein